MLGGLNKAPDDVAKLLDIAPGVKGKGRLEHLNGDVATQQQVSNIAEDITKRERRLDGCIANAGIYGERFVDYPAKEFRKVSASFLHFWPLGNDDARLSRLRCFLKFVERRVRICER
jgi:NAD(P)-dependent dehydrogenase (short-subunit alcohol dehydrogenase family)